MQTTDRIPPENFPAKLAAVRQLDEVLPQGFEAAFRYNDPDRPPAVVTVVGRKDGRTARSVAVAPSHAPYGTFPPYIDAARAEEWGRLPLVLLDL